MIIELALLTKFLYGVLGIAVAGMGIQWTVQNRQKMATSGLANKKDLKSLSGTMGFRISKRFILSLKKCFENVVVIGPPGEGKTVSFFLTQLLYNILPIKSSLIISDKKGELWEKTHKYQESIGRKTIRFKPLGKDARCNLLEQCKDFSEVRELATNIISNAELAMQLSGNRSAGSAEWPNMALPLLTSVLLYCKLHSYPKNTITYAYRILLTNDNEQLTDIMFNIHNSEVLEQFAIYQSCLKDSQEDNGIARSIKITLLTSLALFGDTNLQHSISKSDFTPEMLRNEPIALYIEYEEEEYLAPYMSVFYSFFIKRIQHFKGQNRLPVFFLLDEFQNLGRVTGIQTVLAECRAAEMGFIICLQNLVRLYSIYGRENTVSILNCLKTKCILPSLTDLEALNYISTLAGLKQISVSNYNNGTTTTTKTKIKVFEADEIRRLQDNYVLVIAHNKLPFLDEQEMYFKNDKYSKNVL